MAGIDITGVSTVYPNGVRAVDGLDLRVPDGELFALLGPSGCGKTTLLRTIAGLERPAEGSIAIGSRDVTRVEPGGRGVAMVFQDYALFPHMTVAENIAYPLRVRRVPGARRREVAAEVAAGLGLADLLDRRPGRLSGGQQQRAALGRAVAAGADVLLLDEPLSNLDARLRLEARTFLKRLQHDLALTTVFVTHDQAEALALAHRIAVMDRGRIRQLGTPREVFQRPADTFVANFIGSTPMNLLDGVVRDGHVECAGSRLPGPPGQPDGTPVVVGVRPEYLVPAGDGITGRVAAVENLGVSSLVTLDCPGGALVGFTVPEDREPAPGDRLTVAAPAGRLLFYGAEEGRLLGG
ncbi:ABC transporter ATP-binding protein [Actinosynnema sp. NPDC059335]|uniref:ABC transporter ATP-binding protein n=1 Tax=Actinosynnema sp. NPDC059335 TaxID=3346804 RepID=UPI003670B584